MTDRTQTGAIESAATVEQALALLADPRELPRWAPGFADRVEGSADAGWTVHKGDRRFAIRVATSEAGTVDYLREVVPGREGGAFSRVLPRPGGGCVITLTLPVTPGAGPEDVEAVLRDELRTLVTLLEAA